MTLTDRYLAAIGRNLPKDQADDITAELRDVLLSRREAREAELGRPMGRDEEEALVKEFGHPLVVAARYGRQAYLIGPEVYPFYIHTLRLVLTIIGAVLVTLAVISVISATGHPGGVVSRVISGLWTGGLIGVGAVTAIFALIERYAAPSSLLRNWRPRHLTSEKPRSRWDTVTDITLGAVFVLWWTGVVEFPNLVPVRSGVQVAVDFTPMWQALWWPVLALVVARMVVNLLRLARPGSSVLLALLSSGCAVLGLVLLALVYRAGHWVDVSLIGGSDIAAAKSEHYANLGIQIAILATAAIWTLEGLADLRRLWRAVTQISPGSKIS